MGPWQRQTEVICLKGLRKAGIFLVILILLAAGAAMAAWGTVTECVSVLSGGAGHGEYSLLAADGGTVYTLGRRDRDYIVAMCSYKGRREGAVRLPSDMLPEDSKPAVFYPAPDGSFYLGLYDLSKTPARLELYRFSPDLDEVELVISQVCEGWCLAEQMANTRFSDFTGDENGVSFAVLTGDTAHMYRYDDSGQSLVGLGTRSEPGLRNVRCVNETDWVLLTDSGLIRTDLGELSLGESWIIVQFDAADKGVYFVDGSDLRVYYGNFDNWRPVRHMSLDRTRYDMSDCTDMVVIGDNSAVILLNGNSLVLEENGTVRDISGVLRRTGGQCALILAGLFFGAFLAAVVVWWAVIAQRRSQVPLLLRWGLTMAAVSALAVAGLARIAVPDLARSDAEREALYMISAAVELQKDDCALEELPILTVRDLSTAGGGLYRDLRGGLVRQEGGVWRLISADTADPAGIRAELYEGFDTDMALEAAERGYAFRSVRTGTSHRFYYCRDVGDGVVILDMAGDGLIEKCLDEANWMIWAVIGLGALLTGVALLALHIITRRLNKLAEGMEAVSGGRRRVEVNIDSGDELMCLGEDLTALSKAVSDRESEHERLEGLYRRFIPERLLSLLGKRSVAEVDKQTLVSRELATMRFSFRFPEAAYDRGGQEFFTNVNEVTESASGIVAERGGAVFNFTFDGFDAVFEEGSSASISAAVAIQQRMLEMNREREAEERPRVTARIVLGEGLVILGMVGDGTQIVPTAVSAAISETRRLMELCSRLDATILCTEDVISRAEGYSSRYIGKYSAGGQLMRTYEIFNGDPYESRKFKEQTRDTFAEGVYAFYSRDYAKAKSVFLGLVRRNSGDGCARFYLYLADRMEKDDRTEPSLDLGL